MPRANLVVAVAVVLCLPAFQCDYLDEPQQRESQSIKLKIVGDDAPVGRFPYLCSLRRRGYKAHKCGGTLIHPRWVLTAAHCLDPQTPNGVGLVPVVSCGIYDVDDDNPDHTFNAIGRVHEEWTGDAREGFDIALLKLDRPSNATLPMMNVEANPLQRDQLLMAMGWGYTEEKKVSQKLQMATTLNYIPSRTCDDYWLGAVNQTGVICAGLSHEDTRDGDSGGPLVVGDTSNGLSSEGRPELDLLVGITSYGAESEATPRPGIYTNVGFYADWIYKVIREDDFYFTGAIGTEEEEAQIAFLEGRDLPDLVEELDSDFEETLQGIDSYVKLGVPASEALSSSGAYGELLKEALAAVQIDDSDAAEAALESGLPALIHFDDALFLDGDRNGTLLHSTARFNAPNCTQVLLKHGAKTQERNLLGETPLHHSARYGSDAVAEILLSGGAYVDARDDVGETPLNEASSEGHLQIVLLDHGAYVNATGRWGHTSLHRASSHGYIKILETLLFYKANVNAEDIIGETPLHSACIQGHFPAAKALLEAGAEKEVVSTRGDTPQDVICRDVKCSSAQRASLTNLFAN